MVQAPLTARAAPSRLAGVIVALAMFHVAALVSGHVLGNKSSGIGPVIVTLTVLSFPVIFLTTDLLNEHGGQDVTRRVSALSVACVGVTFMMVELARLLPAAGDSHLPPGAFDHVLAVPAVQAAGLLSGYWFGQVADIRIFHWLRAVTAGRHLWLRALGSTSAGELLDGIVVSLFQFAQSTAGSGAAPRIGELDTTWSQAGIRMGIAIVLLPIVYILHGAINRRRHR